MDNNLIFSIGWFAIGTGFLTLFLATPSAPSHVVNKQETQVSQETSEKCPKLKHNRVIQRNGKCYAVVDGDLEELTDDWLED